MLQHERVLTFPKLVSTAGPVSLSMKWSHFSIPSLYCDYTRGNNRQSGVLRCSSDPNRLSLLQESRLLGVDIRIDANQHRSGLAMPRCSYSLILTENLAASFERELTIVINQGWFNSYRTNDSTRHDWWMIAGQHIPTYGILAAGQHYHHLHRRAVPGYTKGSFVEDLCASIWGLALPKLDYDALHDRVLCASSH